MIRIVRASTLGYLRAEAERRKTLAGLLAEAEESGRYRAAEAARARVAQAEAEAARAAAEAAYQAVLDDTVAGVSRLKLSASDPHTGHGVQAELALMVLRGWIARARASGDQNLISGFQVLDALLGEDTAPAQRPRLRRIRYAHDEVNRAGCVCPLPYCPGGLVPCEAAGRCLQPATGPETRQHHHQPLTGKSPS